jgi:hypothetical protein
MYFYSIILFIFFSTNIFFTIVQLIRKWILKS